MGLKEKFMENMMNQMSFAEKKEMMNEMMDKFFAGISPEEKGELMKEMMGKMMGGASAEGGMPNPMMGMMMGGKEGKGDFNPMDMCKKMMGSMGESRQTAAFATPEIRVLFEEWARQMDAEILNHLESGGETDPERMAAKLKISPESLIYFLARLAQAGKINLKPTKK